jgi:type II secretory pathway predicted ATPase ExeA
MEPADSWAATLDARPANAAPRRVGPLAARAARRRDWGTEPRGGDAWNGPSSTYGSAPAEEPAAPRETDTPGSPVAEPGSAPAAAPAAPASWWPAAAAALSVPQPSLLAGRRPRRPALLLNGAGQLPGLSPLDDSAAEAFVWPAPAPVPSAPSRRPSAELPAPAARASRTAPAGPGSAEDADHDRASAAAEMPVLTGESAPDLYLEHFGLRERPFSLVPDPGFLFWSRAHARAHSILEYGILTRAPITLITGEVGAGKTTLVHHLLRRLGPGVTVGLISNAHGSRGELLRWVLMALGQPVPDGADYVTLFSSFQRFLIEQYATGRRVVLIFDEAQNLDRETLEELRMFTNVNANKDELLQLVLVGQPELRQTIARPDMAQFAQRVAASFHLPAMDMDALRGYIGHRLKVAGASESVFRNNALGLIHEATGGVPRLVNQLCDLALLYAYTRNHKTVSRTTVQHVLDDGVFFGAGRPAAGVAAHGSGGSSDDE